MKNIITLSISLMLVMFVQVIASSQTMRWIPATDLDGINVCPPRQPTREQSLTYVLEYTPATNGVLTSYTTGFLVTCTSRGTSIVKNQSLVMTSKSREISGCNTIGAVLMNSSGNSGEAIHNTVTAGVPVILHQICLSIPEGEVVSILEDDVTGLTSSIEIGGGDPVTEIISYTPVTAGKPRYDQGNPIKTLEFKGTPLENFTSQLDWSVSYAGNHSDFVIEHSIDGITFSKIGVVPSGNDTDHLATYRFLHKDAMEGDNYYRLMQINSQDEKEFSPVRVVSFRTNLFDVSFTPNPADEFLQIECKSQSEITRITLSDASGRIVMKEEKAGNEFSYRLDTRKMSAGIYTLVLESKNDRRTEKVVIAH